MFWLMPATICFSVLFNEPQYAIVHRSVFKFLTNYELSTICCWNLIGICLYGLICLLLLFWLSLGICNSVVNFPSVRQLIFPVVFL